MPNSSCCSKCPKPPLKCKFPPCPCCKCKEKRAKGEPDEENCGRKSNAKKQKYFLAFVLDSICIIAFFIFATTMFWIAVSQQVYIAVVKIHNSDRNTQIVVLVLIALLFLSITFKFIRRKISDRWRARKVAQPAKPAKPVKPPPTLKPTPMPAPQVKVVPETPKPEKSPVVAAAVVTVKATEEDVKVAKVAVAAANIKVTKVNPLTTDVVVATDVQQTRTFASCFRKSGATTVTRNITITISDDEAKEVFKKSKMYAIPTEMKQPPAILVYLRDVILQNMENSQ